MGSEKKMSNDFPKMNTSKQKGQSGQSFVEHFITEEFKWIYHGIPVEKDYGIDAYLEIVDNQNVTGKQIGIQIKHGNSYFKSKTDGGYKYVGEDKHLNYYLNIEQPVILLIIDDDFKRMKWELFEIEKTSPMEKGWWIEIPDNKNLSINTKDIWKSFAAPIIDYKSIIEQNWQIDKIIHDSNFGVISLPRDEIENMDFSYIQSFFKRLSKNKAQLLKSRSSLDFFFPEYDSDPREIYDIPEIRDWFVKSIELHIPWFYYLAYDDKSASLIILLNILAKEEKRTKRNNGYFVELEKESFINFLDIMYMNLNNFTEANDINIEINKEISLGLFDFYKRQLGWDG